MVDVCADAADAFGPAQYDDAHLLRLGHDLGIADDLPAGQENDRQHDPQMHNAR